jgi:hypothetical protein
MLLIHCENIHAYIAQSLETSITRSGSTLRTIDYTSKASTSLNSSPSSSSIKSSDVFILPSVEFSSFQVPKYLPTLEWIRSQSRTAKQSKKQQQQ